MPMIAPMHARYQPSYIRINNVYFLFYLTDETAENVHDRCKLQ